MTINLSKRIGYKMSSKPKTMTLDQYPKRITEKLRYCDTDRQGHINNAVYSTLCESGRVGFLYDEAQPFVQIGTQFVIVKLEINFIEEMNWPGDVIIGSGVSRIGRSSFSLVQGIFRGNNCMATSDSVIVLLDEKKRKSTPLSQVTVDALMSLIVVNPS
jgi:acyl-CoA thioester hydrolase